MFMFPLKNLARKGLKHVYDTLKFHYNMVTILQSTHNIAYSLSLKIIYYMGNNFIIIIFQFETLMI